MESSWFLFDEADASEALALVLKENAKRPLELASMILHGDPRESLADMIADKRVEEIADALDEAADAEHDRLAARRVLSRAAARWEHEVMPVLCDENGKPDWGRIKAVREYQEILHSEL